MNNYKQPGDVLELTAPYATLSGAGAKVGAIFGVATDDVGSGDLGRYKTEGVFTLAKTSAQAWAVGDRIFWNDSTKKCDNDPTVGMLVGFATEVAANPSTTGVVKLSGQAPELLEGQQAVIVALTDSTGDSGTHDDTLADGLTSVAPAAVAAYAAVVNMSEPVAKAEGEAVSAALATLRDSVEAQRAIIATLVTDTTVQNQNTSDLAQKVNELIAALKVQGIIASS